MLPRVDSDNMMIKTGQAHGRIRPRNLRGFTLIEIMVVLALTAILLTLIFRPLIDSFNLVSRAGTQIESQTTARDLVRQVSTEISNSVYIFPNTAPSASVNLWIYNAANTTPSLQKIPYGMVEFVEPSHELDLNPDPNLPIDPTTNLPYSSPSQSASVRSYALPLRRGIVLERMFLGLRDNTSGVDTTGQNQSGMPVLYVPGSTPVYHGYGNQWADPGIFQPQPTGTPHTAQYDNRMSLFKAVVPTFMKSPSTNAYINNFALFHTGTNPNDPTTKTDKSTDAVILDDPNFWYDNSLAGPVDDPTYKQGDPHWGVPGWKDAVGDGKVRVWENWRAVSSSLLETYKADAVALTRDDKGNIVADANGLPQVRPLITFAPVYINNEPAAPSTTSATGAEEPLAAAPAFTTQYGAWTSPYSVLVYRDTTDPNADPMAQNPLTYYQFYYNPANGTSKIVLQSVAPNGTPADPATLPDVGPQMNANGFFTNPNPQFAFLPNPLTGTIDFTFPQSVYVNDGTNPLNQLYAPITVNSGLDNAYQKRYLSLDSLLDTTAYGTMTMLNQVPDQSPLYKFVTNPPDPNAIRQVSMVPGSEMVFGPDQHPGAHYGYRIQYQRVSANAGVVGPNQYRINYFPVQDATYSNDVNDPRIRMGYIEFDSNPDSSSAANLQPNTTGTGATEDPSNGIYRPHSLPVLKYNPATQSNVAADPVEVAYRFQMNRGSDVVKVDYQTRQLMNITISSRLYDPATASPQSTDLTEKVQIRNLQR